MSFPFRNGRTCIALLAACGSLFGTVAPAFAAVGCPRTTELALENKVMCQVCGVPLAVSNSLEANRERAFITKLVNRCDSTAQIEAAMVAQYGTGILATPGSQGFAITAWLMPAAVILVAALGIAAVVAKGPRRRQALPATTTPPATSSEDARLDAALTEHDARA